MQNEKAANSFTKYVREVLNRLKAFFEKIIGKKSIAEESQLMAKQSAAFIAELQKRYDAALLAVREGNAVRNTQNATGGEKVKEQARANTSNYLEYDKPITLKDVELLRSIGRKSINEFTSEDREKAQKWAYKFYKELGVKSPFFRAWFGDWRESTNFDVEVVDTKSDTRKDIVNDDTGWTVKATRQVHKETSNHKGSAEVNAVKYLLYIDDITKKAILFDSVLSDKDNENSLMFHTMYAYTEALGYPALLRLKVEELFYFSNTESGVFQRDYILQNIEEESLSKRNRLSRPNHLKKDSSVISIADLYGLVKTYEKNFHQSEASKIVNPDGTPKIVYHGTNADFTVFDINRSGENYEGHSQYGRGMYFAGGSNGAWEWSRGGKVKEFYLNIKNPFYAHKPTPQHLVDELVKELNLNEWTKNWISKKGEYFIAELNLKGIDSTDFLIKHKFDGIIDEEATTGYAGISAKDRHQYVAFYPEQIKSATDNIGTFDSSNPDIRYQKRIETPGASEVLSELFRDNPNLNGYAEQKQELKSYK